MEEIERRIGAIEADLEHGSAFLTAEAVKVLGDASRTGRNGAAWEAYLVGVAGRLAEAKPAMAGLRNATQALLDRLVQLGPEDGRRAGVSLSEQLLADLKASADSAAANAAMNITAGATVLSCSYSSAVLRSVARAGDEGRAPRVVVYEPERGPDAHGRRLARDVVALGLEARTVDDLAAADVIGSVQLCLTGADAVTASSVLNGSPSLALAHAVKGLAPYYVVCETVKLAREATAAKGYDRIPLSLITAIVTEEGLLGRDEVERRTLGL